MAARINRKMEHKVFKTKNPEGAPAYKLREKERFAAALMTCMWEEPKFYGDTTPQLITDAVTLMQRGKHEFVAKAAAYARNIMHLRTAPVAMLGILASDKAGRLQLPWAAEKVITRADQITEFGAFINSIDRKLMNSRKVQQAVGAAFNRFGEYQLAKYDRPGEVRLRNMLLLSHPVPRDAKQAGVFKRLLEGTMRTPDTWETRSSKGRMKETDWNAMITEGKIGYMALLRNLRNIIKAGADIEAACKIIADPERVAKSKQFPYRFYSAYRELQEVGGANTALKAVGDALRHSAHNVPALDGVTFTTADNSGSMSNSLSSKSVIQHKDVANIFQAMMAVRNPDTITSVFGHEFKVVSIDPSNSPITNAEHFKRTMVGHSTNGHLAVEYLTNRRQKVNRIIMFTDMVLWNTQQGTRGDLYGYQPAMHAAMKQYRELVNEHVWLHLIDLAGYGTSPVWIDYNNRVNMIAGFSDAIFRYIPSVEQGVGGMIEAIESYEG